MNVPEFLAILREEALKNAQAICRYNYPYLHIAILIIQPKIGFPALRLR